MIQFSISFVDATFNKNTQNINEQNNAKEILPKKLQSFANINVILRIIQF